MYTEYLKDYIKKLILYFGIFRSRSFSVCTLVSRESQCLWNSLGRTGLCAFLQFYTGKNISPENFTLPSIFFNSYRSMCIIQYVILDRKDTFKFQNQILAICLP